MRRMESGAIISLQPANSAGDLAHSLETVQSIDDPPKTKSVARTRMKPTSATDNVLEIGFLANGSTSDAPTGHPVNSVHVPPCPAHTLSCFLGVPSLGVCGMLWYS